MVYRSEVKEDVDMTLEEIKELEERSKAHSHSFIHEKFKAVVGKYKPYKPDVDGACWFPNGRNSIRVVDCRFFGGAVIFTYNSDDDWKIESIGSFLSRLNGGK